MLVVRNRNHGYPTYSQRVNNFHSEGNANERFTPSVNIVENDDEYKIELAAPGVSKEEFKIDLDNNRLTISAEHKTDEESSSVNYSRREFDYNSFERSFTLPKDRVAAENIKAAYENGVLEVHLPKKDEVKTEKRAIEVV